MHDCADATCSPANMSLRRFQSWQMDAVNNVEDSLSRFERTSAIAESEATFDERSALISRSIVD
jgi:hypothetical protein